MSEPADRTDRGLAPSSQNRAKTVARSVRPVFSLIRQQPWYFSVAALSWLLFQAWPLIPGLLALEFFNIVTRREGTGMNIPTLLALVAAAGLARIAIIVSGTITGTRWRVVARSQMQRNMLARIYELPGAQAVRGSIGGCISTFRDDVQALSMMGDWVYDSISAAVFITAGIAILASVNALITLTVVPPIVAVAAIAHAARNRFERARDRSRSTTADVTGAIGDFVSGVRAIQAAGKQASVVAYLGRQGEARKRAALRDEFQAAILDGVFASTASLGTGLTLLVSTQAMRSGSFTIGDFALFTNYLLQVTQYTGFVGYLSRTRRQANVSVRRVLDLMQGSPDRHLVLDNPLYLQGGEPLVHQSPPDAAPFTHLAVCGLTVRYPASDRGIRDVSFTVTAGTLTVITGEIGSGKTTLLRAILGLIDSASGHVYWNSAKISAPESFFGPPRVSYSAQNPALLPGTVKENILLGLPDDEASVGRSVYGAVLDAEITATPSWLDTEIGTRGIRLSGGQIQRVAAARMLVHEAELLIFDDLSSALDIETELELWRRLAETGTTCLAVSHRRTVLERADQIVVLKDGAVAKIGTLTDLLRAGQDTKALYGPDEAELVNPGGV